MALVTRVEPTALSAHHRKMKCTSVHRVVMTRTLSSWCKRRDRNTLALLLLLRDLSVPLKEILVYTTIRDLSVYNCDILVCTPILDLGVYHYKSQNGRRRIQGYLNVNSANEEDIVEQPNET